MLLGLFHDTEISMGRCVLSIKNCAWLRIWSNLPAVLYLSIAMASIYTGSQRTLEVVIDTVIEPCPGYLKIADEATRSFDYVAFDSLWTNQIHALALWACVEKRGPTSRYPPLLADEL